MLAKWKKANLKTRKAYRKAFNGDAQWASYTEIDGVKVLDMLWDALGIESQHEKGRTYPKLLAKFRKSGLRTMTELKAAYRNDCAWLSKNNKPNKDPEKDRLLDRLKADLGIKKLKNQYCKNRRPFIATCKKTGVELEFTYPSEAAETLSIGNTKVLSGNITAVLNGKSGRKSSAGYTFRYKDKVKKKGKKQ